MIIDRADRILYYRELLPHIEAGLEALKSLPVPEPGRYEFEGGYFTIQKGITRPVEEGTYEAHRRYIDVQILLEGSEELAWQDLRELETVTAYDPQKDQERLDGPKNHVILISEGMFYAVFPNDAHKAVSHTEQPRNFLKAVMKLPAAEAYCREEKKND